MVYSKRYNDWLGMAEKDLNGAKILFEHDGDYGIVCFHCQQAVEKYLKGYLIYKNGMLFEGHNLLKLCKKANEFNDGFRNFIKDCTFLNSFYIETRYPAEDLLTVLKSDVEECLKIVDNIKGFIEKSLVLNEK